MKRFNDDVLSARPADNNTSIGGIAPSLRKATTFISILLIAVTTSFAVPSSALAAKPGPTANTGPSVSEWSQCANGTGTAVTCVKLWINGDLQSNNSHYHEDDVVPQRAVINIPSGNTAASHTIAIRYLIRKGSANAHAYDSLATWNDTVTSADACQSLSPCPATGTPSKVTIPDDPSVVNPVGSGGISNVTSAHMMPGCTPMPTCVAPQRQMWLYGGTITGMSYSPATLDASVTGTDVDRTLVVTFTASGNANQNRTLELLFGGHLAVGPTGATGSPRGWGTGLGAANINGGPYHIIMDALDGSGGGQDNNIQANAILPLGAPAFKVTKIVKDLAGNTITSATPGQTIQYVITVQNTGTAAGSTSVTDTYDSRLTSITNITQPAGASTGVNSTANHQVTWSNSGTITEGTSATFTFNATIPTTFSTSPPDSTPSPYPCTTAQFDIVNDVSVTGSTAHTDTCVGAGPTFTVTKKATNPTTGATITSAAPGDTIRYVITVTNTGSTPGSTTVTDTYDSRLTNIGSFSKTPTSSISPTVANPITWDSGTLAGGGGQIVISFNATIPSTFTGTPNPNDASKCPGTFDIINQVSVTGSSDQTDTCVSASPSFTVTKKATNPNTGATITSAAPGDTIRYVITVTNNGTAPGSTTVTDTYDSRLTNIGNFSKTPTSSISPTVANPITWDSGTLAGGGGQIVITFDATIPATFSGTPDNTSACPGTFDIINKVSVTGSSTQTDTCVAANPAFTVTKVVKNAAGQVITSANPGDTVTYVITVTNNGTASGSTTVTDTYDSRLTNIGNFSKTPTSSISPTVANPITWDSGTLAGGGGQLIITFTAQIPLNFTGNPNPSNDTMCPGSFDIINLVSVTGSSASTDTCVSASPSFTVTKVVKNAAGNVITAANPGDTITYVITVTNNGHASGSTTVTDTYDSRLTNIGNFSKTPTSSISPTVVNPITWDSGTLAGGGGQIVITFNATIPSTFTGSPDNTTACPRTFDIINKVSVTGSSAQTDTCVSASPAFTITKKATNPTTGATITSASPGDTIRYVITVTNNGTASGSTTVTDTYDSRLTNIGSFSKTPTSSISPTVANPITWDSGTLAGGGGQIVIAFNATIPSTFTGTPNPNDASKCPGTFDIINQVSVTGSSDQTDTCVAASPSFTVTKVVKNAAGQVITSAKPGDTLTYVITVTNNGTASGSTTVTDTYDSRLTNIGNFSKTPTSSISPTVANPITWDSGTLAGGGGQLVITFNATIPSSFVGTPDNTTACPGTFDIINKVSVTGSSAQTDTCVTANPAFSVVKVAENAAGQVITSANPGDTITYVITVTNTGQASGSTPVTDTYDSRLTNITNITQPVGAATGANDPTAHTVTWTSSGSIDPGSTAVFTFDATIPQNFTGDPTSSGPCAGKFDIINKVTVTGNNTQNDLCVTATPNLSLVKSADKTLVTGGNQITYTLTYSNTGSASAEATTITETIPANTSFASCSNSCTTTSSGNPPVVTGVTWSIGSVAGHSSGFVTLTVNVLNSVGCQVCNTASIQSRSFNGGQSVNSNTLCINSTPVANPAGAHANGNAFGLYVHEGLLVPLDVTSTQTSSTQSGVGVDSHNDSLLTAVVPNIVTADVLGVSSSSVVSSTTNSADQTTTAETAGLNVLNGLVTAQVVRSVATTHADGGSSSFSSLGSTIVGLQVNGVAYNTITPGLTITLPKLVFGNGSYVKVYDRIGSTSSPASGQTSGGTYAADLTVNMIHVHITKLLLPLGGTALLDVTVSHAAAHSDFPQTTVCNPVPKQSVSGHAFIASENTDPSILPILYGYASIPSTGGHDFKTLNTLDIPPSSGSVLHLGVTDDDVNGQPGALSSNSSSYAEAANVCLLKTATGVCTIGATALKSEATSTANASGATSSDLGTQFTNLQILGQTISLPVAPNTVINLQGLGFVILNEQFCDNGPTPIGPGPVAPCAGATHSGLTVRAIHVVLTLPPPPGTVLGLQLIVAEAHSDATFTP